jgi:hypothetical protein
MTDRTDVSRRFVEHWITSRRLRDLRPGDATRVWIGNHERLTTLEAEAVD